MPPISVLIAARGQASRAACLGLLRPEKGIQVVGEVRRDLDVITAAAQLKPRILLLDQRMIAERGRAVLPLIRRKSPETRVILLTERASESRTLDALSQGARGYLERSALRGFLPKAVRAVEAGEGWVPRKMVAKVMDRLARLTVRAGEPLGGHAPN